MLGETSLEHRDALIPKACEPLISSRLIEGCTAQEWRIDIEVRSLQVLHEVDKGIDGPSRHGIIAVVPIS